MKSTSSKIFGLLGISLCLVIAILFANQKLVTKVSADNEMFSVTAESKPETRCGWFSNPTPSNAWLNDKDGEWLVSAQGGYQAKGDWGADFKPNQWVKTNVNYGYGCACMSVTTNKRTRRVLTIKNFSARPLSVCRRDKRLKEPK